MATPEHDPPIIGWLDDEETVELTLAPEPQPPATTITVSGVTYTARAAGEWVEVDVTAGPGRPLTGGPYMVAGGGSGGSGGMVRHATEDDDAPERCARCHAEPRHTGSELCVRCLWPEPVGVHEVDANVFGEGREIARRAAANEQPSIAGANTVGAGGAPASVAAIDVGTVTVERGPERVAVRTETAGGGTGRIEGSRAPRTYDCPEHEEMCGGEDCCCADLHRPHEPFPRSPRGLDDHGLRPAPPPLCTLTAWCVEQPGHAGACTPRPADAFPPADFGPRAATSTRRGRT